MLPRYARTVGEAFAGSAARSMLYLKSLAVTRRVLPVWNTTSSRSLNVYVLPPLETSQFLAMSGCDLQVGVQRDQAAEDLDDVLARGIIADLDRVEDRVRVVPRDDERLAAADAADRVLRGLSSSLSDGLAGDASSSPPPPASATTNTTPTARIRKATKPIIRVSMRFDIGTHPEGLSADTPAGPWDDSSRDRTGSASKRTREPHAAHIGRR